MNADVIVIGGGPAGATLAALLAKGGISTIVIEKETFPRYHIGESLVPQVLDVLEEAGSLSDIEAAGFLRKEGGIFRWGKNQEPWTFYFDEASYRYRHTHAYQVVRSTFDEILLDNARRAGANVLENVTAEEFSTNSDGNTVWDKSQVGCRLADGTKSVFSAKLVVDCSGQAGWLASKLGLRIYDPNLRNVALFSYFTDATRLTGREANSIFCEATASGWIWNIPLHNGTNSVGFITKPPIGNSGRERSQFYEKGIQTSIFTRDMLASASRVTDIQCVADYSYRPRCLVGPGFMLVGDAGNFIDPVWSTGVFLATAGASMAAKSIVTLFESGTLNSLQDYETKTQRLVDSYREFIYYFYNTNANPQTYFWKAYSLVSGAVDPRDAFIRLVSGHLGLDESVNEESRKNTNNHHSTVSSR